MPSREHLGAAVGSIALAVVACALAAPLGALRGPFLLVVALPITARAFASLGWVPVAAVSPR